LNPKNLNPKNRSRTNSTHRLRRASLQLKKERATERALAQASLAVWDGMGWPSGARLARGLNVRLRPQMRR
jgi:hypothetical protein